MSGVIGPAPRKPNVNWQTASDEGRRVGGVCSSDGIPQNPIQFGLRCEVILAEVHLPTTKWASRRAPLNPRQPRPARQRLGVRWVRGEGTHRFRFDPPQASQSGVSPVPRQPPHSKTSRQFGRFNWKTESDVLRPPWVMSWRWYSAAWRHASPTPRCRSTRRSSREAEAPVQAS